MAKKKSKTQKSKKNQKKKLQTINKNSQTNKVVKNSTPNKTNNQNKKKTTNSVAKQVPKPEPSKEINQETPKKQVVDKDKVKYNVLLTNNNLKKDTQKKEEVKEIPKKNTQKVSSSILKKVKNKPNKKVQKKVVEKPKNIFLRLLYDVFHNTHIIFNSLLIVTYVILLTGFIRTNAFTTGTIVYVSCIIIFLSIVAIGYNKYISGKIFSTLIIIGMSIAIYNMQYTYDFIRNLNTNEFEYKEYYVVTFNNGRNKSIYNINNKKVGLLKDNSTNIQRILNTKLDSVNYIEYEDPNLFYQDFYNQSYRAIIVNDNQYKYLTNNIEQSNKKVKILYKFKANGRK